VLHIHRAERADRLAIALAGLLAMPLADPFVGEIVSVPTRGMERWLAQRLSSHLGAQPGRADGVCAGVLFPPPRRLIGDAVAAASGIDPEADPWLPERAAWPLLDVVQECLNQPWLDALRGYLGHAESEPDPVRRDRRLSIVRHLAALFARYSLHRPEMVGAWAAGEDGDGDGGQLPPGSAWQAQLWRALRARIALPSPAERLEDACAQLGEDGSLVDLPARVALFGLTRLPAGDLHVLRALAAQRDVHLFLLHPSPALWERVGQVSAPGVGAWRADVARPVAPRRDHDPTADLAAHPLLASWGRDAREMQVVLSGAGTGHADHHHPLPPAPATALGRLQAALLADQAPPGEPLAGEPDRRGALDPADRSVQVHACHGQARQVEVLRDAVLHLLAADPALEPRDVIVMCPDIETFAPLIQATFGAAATEPGEEPPGGGPVDLHVRLADRSLRQTNAVLAALAALLELAGSRVTASQVLGFADREPVRRRFGLRDDDLTRLQRWIGDAGIRWGLDAAHRAPFKLEDLETGTWAAGLNRLLLGVAMTEEGNRLYGGVLPLDDVESTAIDLAGRLGELVDRVQDALERLSAPQPLGAWAGALTHAAQSLTATGPRDAWQHAELQRMLDELVAQAGGDPGPGGAADRQPGGAAPAAATQRALSLAEVRGLLAERLAGRPTRANFRTGHMTVCTLYPMRSVPHRVVCLLGLDDGAFPRRLPRDGDDLMLDRPRVGERDPRSEDRQMLLDAVLAATEHLLITYTGHDERTNLPRPPAVPVGELLDVIDATVRGTAGPARAQLQVGHPLQPFDPRNFAPGAIVPERRWSFDQVALGGARALRAPRVASPPFLDAPLPAPGEPVIALDDLVRFVEHPVRAFLRQRLAVRLGEIDDEVDDSLPVELDPLELWQVGQRLLEARLTGVDGTAAIRAEIARGTLPPGVLGKPVIARLYPVVEAIAQIAHGFAPAGSESKPIDVQLTLGDGRLLSGTVGVRGEGVLANTTYSRLAPKHRLAAWVRLLAATAAAPEQPLSSATIGRAGRDADERAVMVSVIPALGGDPTTRARAANEALHGLVDLYDRGLREPLPLPCASAAAYARARHVGEDALADARAQWESAFNYPREDQELEHQLALGGQLTVEELMAIPARSDECGEGWLEAEPSRFARLAHRLWSGLLTREELAIR
jgi:exodeoxyribonuclease V gamma subunit